MDTPPKTRHDGTSYERHGTRIEDPYLWLEDAEGERDAIDEWVDAQNEYANSSLESIDVRERLEPEFEAVARVTDYGSVIARPSGYFQEIDRPEDEQAVLTHRDSLQDEREVLVDPNEWSEDATVAMGWWSLSPAGDRLAYGVDEGGDEQYDVTVIEVDSGAVVDELEDLGRCHSVAWAPNGLYYYRTGSADDGGQLEKSIHYHEFGTDAADDEELRTIEDASTWPQLQTDRDQRHLIVTLVSAWERSEVFHAPVDPAGGHDLSPVLEGTEHLFVPTIHDETVYLRTNHDAQNYRLTAFDLGPVAGPIEPDELRDVVPEREGILKNTTVVGSGGPGVGPTATDALVCRYETAAVSSLEAFDLQGEYLATVDLPSLGTVTGLSGNRDAPELFFGYESFDQPPAVYRTALVDDGSTGDGARGASDADATIAGPTPEELDRPDLEVDLPLTVEQVWYESSNDVEVPMFVVHRAGLDLDGDNPALLYGYGGFEISQTPSFNRFAQPFLRAGGVYAVGNFRGGGEFGKEWHRAARHDRKQHTFDDAINAAECLIEEGYTSSDRLAIRGGSNGGLTVGAVLTQRPDLMRAVCCQVPLLDMLRFHTFLLGESWTTEYGSPEDPDAFEWILEYSPYHNVSEAAYPAVLFKTAEGDTRVHPVHAWKMAARLQAHTESEHPILCKTQRDTGHGTGKPTWMIVEEALDVWSFLFEELGVEYVEDSSR